MPRTVRLLIAIVFALALSGCEDTPSAGPTVAEESAVESSPEVAAVAEAPAADAESRERHEATDRYEYRVRWSDAIAQDVGMDAAMRAIADDRLQEFIEAAAAAPADAARWTFELEFRPCDGTAGLKCIAGDGSVYAGGAHPLPIIERLLYSTTQSKALRPDQLFTDADAALRAIGVYAREMLLTQRIAQASVAGAPADAAARAAMRGEIASGAEPSPENYRLAEPVVSGSGKINALRFLFAPYQVASYAEGTLVAEVPASVFAQWIRPEYAGEFITR